MKIYVQQYGYNIFFPFLFLLFPRDKLGVYAWLHAVKHCSVVVCDFCWFIPPRARCSISEFMLLNEGIIFCPFLRRLTKSEEWNTLSVTEGPGCSLCAWQCKMLPKYWMELVAYLMPYLLHWRVCLFCAYQYVQLCHTIFFNA